MDEVIKIKWLKKKPRSMQHYIISRNLSLNHR